MFPNIKIVEAIRKEYPAGTRVRLVKMDDIQAPPLGAEKVRLLVSMIPAAS